MTTTPPKTRADTVIDLIDEALAEPPRQPIRLPEPLKSFEDAGEPRRLLGWRQPNGDVWDWKASRDSEPVWGDELPLAEWFDGRDQESARSVGRPITGRHIGVVEDVPPRSARRGRVAVEHVPTTVLDRRVQSIINDRPWLYRWQIDDEYARRHGPYPGRSTYNSIWRLRRDGLVQRIGHEWGPTRQAVSELE